MQRVSACPIPANSLLDGCARSGAYADCFAAEVEARVSHAQFVQAFYTTPLFKLERALLALVLRRACTDELIARVARGQASSFAAWSVEGRADNELLLAAGRTKSWLMVVSPGTGGDGSTRLLFGSAVVPRRSVAGQRGDMGVVFHALLGVHKLYSRALLSSATARLMRLQRAAWPCVRMLLPRMKSRPSR